MRSDFAVLAYGDIEVSCDRNSIRSGEYDFLKVDIRRSQIQGSGESCEMEFQHRREWRVPEIDHLCSVVLVGSYGIHKRVRHCAVRVLFVVRRAGIGSRIAVSVEDAELRRTYMRPYGNAAAVRGRSDACIVAIVDGWINGIEVALLGPVHSPLHAEFASLVKAVGKILEDFVSIRICVCNLVFSTIASADAVRSVNENLVTVLPIDLDACRGFFAIGSSGCAVVAQISRKAYFLSRSRSHLFQFLLYAGAQNEGESCQT